MKRIVVVFTILAVMLIGATVAFASGVIKTPAEIVSGLTGKPVDDVTEARRNGQTYGKQAAAAGKLEEFKAERLAQYKLALDEAVKDGRITAAQADKLYAAMEQRMKTCTGTGSGNGSCAGNGMGGFGRNGCGRGMGTGIQNGSCGNCNLNN